MHNKEPIDWQASMEATELAATAAAKTTERTINGLAWLIEGQNRHSSKTQLVQKELLKLTEEIQSVKDLVAQPPQKIVLRRPHSLRLMLATFVAGGLFGVFIAS